MAGMESTNKNTDAGQSGVTNADESQCVVFSLFNEEFGVDINNVKEIVRLPDITPIPRSPEYVSGICNLRGNVLPVIDTRIRFGLETQKATDQTRLLVVETGGRQNSLVVDHVKEVMRMKHSLVEPPPSICRGVDREFLNGVVKVDGGNRLILMLNLPEVIALDMKSVKSGTDATRAGQEIFEEEKSVTDEEQLVSFRVGGDEYAFDIKRVSEILKVMDITAVPNVPEYVLGMFTIRNHLLPILDMRGLLGLPSLISERHDMLDKAREDESKWADAIRHAIDANSRFAGGLVARESSFGKWLEGYNTASVEVEGLVKRLKRMRADLYNTGKRLLDLSTGDKGVDLASYEEHLTPILKVVLDIIGELKESMSAHISEDQRAMVVECGDMTIGYLVDWVDEVLRIPKSVINETPAMATSDRKELKAVAKLDDGKRLIMIMDESSLVSGETSAMLNQIQAQSEAGKHATADSGRSLAQESIDEEQLVTFSIGKEEYGIRIMQVQEINRLADVTHVPRAPYFIDGMTNLRGNIIPVINIRRLFNLETREADDRTRVIIVDIGGNKTGLRVDAVNEVLRLNRNDIDPAPDIVTENGAGKLMQGICKIENGNRMVVLLDVSEILDKKEMKTLQTLTSGHDDTAVKLGAQSIGSGKTTAKKGTSGKSKLEIAE
ncbi:MAG: chemotaxis protein CheW [Pseudomonadota bacterium]